MERMERIHFRILKSIIVIILLLSALRHFTSIKCILGGSVTLVSSFEIIYLKVLKIKYM